MSTLQATITANLDRTRERVAAAAARAGRSAEDVTLIAVSKAKPPEAVEAAIRAGATDLGESRVQELVAKLPILDGRVRVHFIGHLQRNKAARATAHSALIHAVDSVALVTAIDRHAGDLAKVQLVLLEVNTSGDESKFGVAPDELSALVEAAVACENVRVCGLMTIAPLLGGDQAARRSFRQLVGLADLLRGAGVPEPIELSMGMSNDFEIAIEEGSTMVRVGTAIFGERGVT